MLFGLQYSSGIGTPAAAKNSPSSMENLEHSSHELQWEWCICLLRKLWSSRPKVFLALLSCMSPKRQKKKVRACETGSGRGWGSERPSRAWSGNPAETDHVPQALCYQHLFGGKEQAFSPSRMREHWAPNTAFCRIPRSLKLALVSLPDPVDTEIRISKAEKIVEQGNKGNMGLQELNAQIFQIKFLLHS